MTLYFPVLEFFLTAQVDGNSQREQTIVFKGNYHTK